VSDFGTAPGGQPYLVMEYLEGEDLADRLNRVGRLPLATALGIANQVASALTATHAKGVVHRDLKPENVFLLKVEGVSDFVKVVDFGISKVKHSDEKLTRASVMMGTPAYMAPEQATGRVDDIDHRTDQWALACLVWEMLTGDEPFVGKDTPTVLYSIVHGELPPLNMPNLPAGVEAVLRRALSKRQSDRFPTISAFTRAFTAATTPAPALAARTPTPLVVPAAVRTPVAVRTTVANQTKTAWSPAWSFPWWRKRKRGVVGMTVAAGKKAIEELLPARGRRPRRLVAWLSAAALGVALSVGAVIYFRPRAPVPAVVVPPPPPPKAVEVGKAAKVRRDHPPARRATGATEREAR
jgi:serine/threonine protein kinase